MSERWGNRQKYESRNPIQRGLIRWFQRQAIQLIRRARPRTILDVGCGEGYMLDALVTAGIDAELTGVDLAPDAVEDARERLGSRATIELVDARELAGDGRQFDLVMMTEVLEHIPGPEGMLPILAELSREWLVLSVPWEPFFRGLNLLRGKHLSRLGNDPEHVNLWGRSGFLGFVGHDFEVVEAPLAFPWTLVLARLGAR